jgi:hypothetical protein
VESLDSAPVDVTALTVNVYVPGFRPGITNDSVVGSSMYATSCQTFTPL